MSTLMLTQLVCVYFHANSIATRVLFDNSKQIAHIYGVIINVQDGRLCLYVCVRACLCLYRMNVYIHVHVCVCPC